jgi:hypothetical protein
VEQAVNERFLLHISDMFGPKSETVIGSAIKVLQDFILEGRKIQREFRESFQSGHGEHPDPSWRVSKLLIHTPIQLWPLPYIQQCPCSHCMEFPEMADMENHIQVRHPGVQAGGTYSEVHSHIGSILGCAFELREPKGWKCPMEDCNKIYRDLRSVKIHVEIEHKPPVNELYGKVGGFWTAILSYVHNYGEWPVIQDILREQGEVTQLSRVEADQLWRSNEMKRDLPKRQIQQSPLEWLLIDLRMWTTVEGRSFRRHKNWEQFQAQYGNGKWENEGQVENWLMEQEQMQEREYMAQQLRELEMEREKWASRSSQSESGTTESSEEIDQQVTEIPQENDWTEELRRENQRRREEQEEQKRRRRVHEALVKAKRRLTEREEEERRRERLNQQRREEEKAAREWQETLNRERERKMEEEEEHRRQEEISREREEEQTEIQARMWVEESEREITWTQIQEEKRLEEEERFRSPDVPEPEELDETEHEEIPEEQKGQ